MAELLRNGGFEADWGEERSHRCHVFPVEAGPYFADLGNVFVPPGWVAWFRHDGEDLAQPEGGDIGKSPDPRRVRSGDRAYKLFTFHRKHDAGLYQQIEAQPGSRLRLIAWAHAWSNHKGEGFPHPSDGRWSEGVGYDERTILEGEAPELNGDPQNDALGNFTFAVGIDPLGGDDPLADSVMWGRGAHIYNGFHEVPPVEVEAQADTVTVFLRSKTLWAFKHNDAYWDDVVLEMVESAGPEPESGRGEPRMQYARTYVLMPPGAGADLALDVVEETWDQERWTVGGSADDAGIGNLDERTVIALNPGAWDGLYKFFAEWYPGVAYYWPLEWDNVYQLRGRLAAYSLRQDGVRLAYPTTHWPPVITDEFGVARGDYFHNGLDLRSSHAAYQDELVAALDGRVIVAGENEQEPWFGWQVRTECDVGGRRVLVRYAHLVPDSIVAEVGDVLEVGDFVGLPDNTGQSTGDHLHLDVRMIEPDGRSRYADPALLMEWPKDEEESKLLVGLHDGAGADWMLESGIEGAALAMAVVGDDESLRLDFRRYRDAGIEIYLRLGYGYADGSGTMPGPDRLADWIRAMAGTINRVQGVAGIVICNEINNPAEWPGGWPHPSYIVSPEYYGAAFHAIRLLVTADVPLALAALDPYNVVAGQFGIEADPAAWALYLYHHCAGDVGWVALHAKTQGSDLDQITGEASYETFIDPPLEGRYMHLRTLQDQLLWIPITLAELPVVVTELNPQRRRDGSLGWDENGAEWVAAALDYVAGLASRAVLYRFEEAGDQAPFGLARRPGVLEAMRQYG